MCLNLERMTKRITIFILIMFLSGNEKVNVANDIKADVKTTRY